MESQKICPKQTNQDREISRFEKKEDTDLKKRIITCKNICEEENGVEN